MTGQQKRSILLKAAIKCAEGISVFSCNSITSGSSKERPTQESLLEWNLKVCSLRNQYCAFYDFHIGKSACIDSNNEDGRLIRSLCLLLFRETL